MKPSVMQRISLLLLAIAAPFVLQAQGRIILNGGRVNITNSAVVVVANSNTNAITRLSNGGHFVSEGADNRIRWNIGTSTGTYVIPWGTPSGNYIPLSLVPSTATGTNGYFYFATYQSASQNSLNLPPGVGNFNTPEGSDASLVAVDRFWRIEPLSYTANPAMGNLTFSYPDAEYASPNKTTIENKLIALRWNPTQSTWHDFVPGATTNASTNTVMLSSLPSAQLHPWWSLQYPGSSFHWIGTTAGNYSVPANWSATAGGTGGLGVPGPGDAVFFDDVRDGTCTVNTTVDVAKWTVASGYTGTISNTSNAMVIEGDANFSSGSFAGGTASMSISGNLTIAGTTFTAPSNTLDVKKNLTVSSGSFIHNSGTIRFSGTTGTQTINAPAATFYNIDATNTSASPGLIFESNNQLAGVLTLGTNVVVDPDGNADNRILTLLSTSDSPTADAAIGILPAGASVNGRVTVQRYMSIEGASGGRIYRYVASPINAATVADLQGEIPITGTFTGMSRCTGCGSAQSMFEYDESILTDVNKNGTADFDDGYIDFPKIANTETLEPGKGYALFVRGNVLTSARWDVRGRINAGNGSPIDLPVSYTFSGVTGNDGWNLVGNPYPSTIDWSAASGWTKTNMNNAIYTRDNAAAGQFATWNGVTGTNGGTRYIATGQAFWVKANGAAPTLTASENVKAPGIQTTFFRDQAPQNLLRITLSQGSVKDEAVVHLRDDATASFDVEADAAKLPNTSFNLSTQMNGQDKLAINSLNLSACSHTMNLVVENVAQGNYSLSFEGLESFLNGATVKLTDAFTNTTVDVTGASNYAFNVTANTASYGSARFALTIVREAAPTDFEVSATAVCEGADGSIQLEKTSPRNVYAVLINDQLATAQDGSEGSMTMAIAAQQLVAGNNLITVRATPSGACGNPVSKTVNVMVDQRAAVQSVAATPICREGQATLSATGAAAGQEYRWYATAAHDDVVLSSAATFTTPVLTKKATYYVAIVNASGCEGERTAVIADVTRYDDPQITLSGDSLYTTYPGPKQWYLDGVALPADTLMSIKAQQSGVFSVTVAVGTCKATAMARYEKPEVVTGIPETSPATLQVYPNPVRGYLYFQSQDAAVKRVSVQNISGQTLGGVELQQGKGKFDMSSFSAGLYLIQVESQEGTKEIKIIKE